ncbi:flagellar assembly protein A [Candidatus Latescibacterota bacterium]
MDEEKKEEKKDVNVLIEVSEDKVEVYITLIPQTKNTEFTTEQIRKALSDKGIVFGIKKEVLELFDKDIKYNERLLIASGKKPKEGEDGKIEYSFESNKTVKVKKGEKIGEIIHPVEGVDGITVFDKKIPTRKVQKAQIPKLTNVEISPENENILIAKIDGYLFIDQFSVQLKPIFELEILDDKYEAYIKVNKPLNDVGLNSEDLKRFLAEKGIVYGINNEEIENIFKEVIFEKYDERLLIASGKKPKEGEDGKIEYSFEINKTVKVKKGEKIGEIIHPVEGIDGMTVIEEKIHPRQVQKAEIPKLTNVGLSPENKDILIAEIDGYLFIDNFNIHLTPFFELEISDDKYKAYVKVKKPLNEDDYIAEDLKRFLNDNGIVYGILEKEIEKIFKQKKFEQAVLVAKGRELVDEKDGQIKYYFDTEIKPQMDEAGNVDYKELNLIQNVQTGDKLVEISPPEEGVEGCTIFGEKIAPKKGVQPLLPIGKNTRSDPNNPNILISEIDGSVELKGTNVEVINVYIVKKDVDFSTGNVNFSGSVMVNGDVRSGFKIIAQDDIQINGVVEDAVIKSNGNVLLKTGFVGRGKGQIIAQGNVTTKFCENETIIAEGDIYISEYVMHSKIITKGNLYVTDKTGLIVGGETYAGKGIEANVVGNENYAPTKLFVGVDMVTKAYLEKNTEQIIDLEKFLNKSHRRKLLKKELPEEKKNLIDKLKQLRNEKVKENNKLIAEIEKSDDRADEFKKAVVKIFDVVYPGTSITIYNEQIMVNEPIKYVYYKYTEDEIVAADLEGLE